MLLFLCPEKAAWTHFCPHKVPVHSHLKGRKSKEKSSPLCIILLLPGLKFNKFLSLSWTRISRIPSRVSNHWPVRVLLSQPSFAEKSLWPLTFLVTVTSWTFFSLTRHFVFMFLNRRSPYSKEVFDYETWSWAIERVNSRLQVVPLMRGLTARVTLLILCL